MCGESLLADTIFSSQTNENMGWADMTEFWYDLSHTIKMIEENFNDLVTDSSMAQLWCILDPYANVVFIEKTVRLLKEGIAVKASRTLMIESDARPKAKHLKVSGYGRNCFKPKIMQDWDYNDHNCDNVPDQVGSEVSSELTESPDNNKFDWPRRLNGKSWNMSELKLNDLVDSSFPGCERSSSKRPYKKSKFSIPRDDDLLISAMVKSKNLRATKKQSSCKRKPLGKRKTPKGSCKLLPRRFKKGGKQVTEGKWSLVESRTVLSWMIHCNVISFNDVIQYRNTDDGLILKDGAITRDGILCNCCHKVLSITEFNCHAGFRLKQPCTNLFMKSGKSFILCQLETWSVDFRARQMTPQINPVDSVDHNDDSCGCCGDVGELLCCDNCPSAFHMSCLFEKELPEGSWYCPRCRCQICGDVVIDNGPSDLLCGWKCHQCEHKYHKTCRERSCMQIGLPSATWFCGDGCHKVYAGLESRLGLKNFIANGLSWTLLRCISIDHKASTSQHAVALEAECNSKLAVAITILEECFLPMVDSRTGISMIPQVIFNLGSQFARLDYSGFYTVVLQEDDAIMCVASIRIHGTEVAELPLIATCSRNRRRGMCRLLIDSIETMLTSLNIKKLVLSAIPELLETWIVGFGFEPLDKDERQSLSLINLMVFPRSIWLKKTLNQATDKRKRMLPSGSPGDVMSNTWDGVVDKRDHQSVDDPRETLSIDHENKYNLFCAKETNSLHSDNAEDALVQEEMEIAPESQASEE